MEVSEVRRLLGSIGESAAALSANRGRHAAALWTVHDYLGHLDGGLIEHADDAELDRSGAHLSIRTKPSVISNVEQWGLFIDSGEHALPAYKASAALQVAAVRRLPEYLTAYTDSLKASAGSARTVEIADAIVQAFDKSEAPQS